MKYKMWFPWDQRFMWMTPQDMPHYDLMFDGEISEELPDTTRDSALEFLWRRHNMGDNSDGNRPKAKEIRSLSVGDIIEFEGPEYWIVESIGWRQLSTEELPKFGEVV